MHPLRATRAAARWPTAATLYWRLTLGFTLGLYLPWAATAPDLARHFGEAVHTWAVLFFAPLAAWHLLVDAFVRTPDRTDDGPRHLPTRSSRPRRAMSSDH